MWRYPSHQWAREHVPDLPHRCYVAIHAGDERRQRSGPSAMAMRKECPDPFGHLVTHEAIRATAASGQSQEEVEER